MLSPRWISHSPNVERGALRVSNDTKLAMALEKCATTNRRYATESYLKAARQGVLLPPVGDLRLSPLSSDAEGYAYTDARIHEECMEHPKYVRFHKSDSMLRASVSRIRLMVSAIIATEAKYYELGLLEGVSHDEYMGVRKRPALGSLIDDYAPTLF